MCIVESIEHNHKKFHVPMPNLILPHPRGPDAVTRFLVDAMGWWSKKQGQWQVLHSYSTRYLLDLLLNSFAVELLFIETPSSLAWPVFL